MTLGLPSSGKKSYAANWPLPEIDTLETTPPVGVTIAVFTPVARSRTYGAPPEMKTNRPSVLENEPCSAYASVATVDVTPVPTRVRFRLPSAHRVDTHCPLG